MSRELRSFIISEYRNTPVAEFASELAAFLTNSTGFRYFCHRGSDLTLVRQYDFEPIFLDFVSSMVRIGKDSSSITSLLKETEPVLLSVYVSLFLAEFKIEVDSILSKNLTDFTLQDFEETRLLKLFLTYPYLNSSSNLKNVLIRTFTVTPNNSVTDFRVPTDSVFTGVWDNHNSGQVAPRDSETESPLARALRLQRESV